MLTFNKTNRWFRKIAYMTEWNQHGLRLEEVASACAEQAKEGGDGYASAEYGAYLEEFKKINSEHARAGHLPLPLFIRRNALSNEMERRIEKDFGADVAAKIRKN